VSTTVLSAVVRITTNGRIFKSPTSIGEAFEFCQSLLTQPHCQPVEPGERHWDIFRNLCVRSEVRGPRVTDAWFAALAIESGSQWITLDRDFARFPGLDWRVPEI
jgi:toxin-antitoxin system PIN domain toxin